MLSIIKSRLCLSVFVFAALACALSNAPERHVRGTSQYIFAFDKEGNILWKTPIESRAGGWYSPDTSVLEFGKAIRAYDGRDGKLLWEIKFDKEIKSSIGEGSHRLKINLRGDSTYTVIERTTGRILGTEPIELVEAERSKRHPQQDPIIDSLMKSTRQACPLETPEIYIETTTKWIFAFDSTASILWRLKLPKGWRVPHNHPYPYSGEGNAIGLCYERDVMGLDRLTGKLLYRSKLPAPIEMSSFSCGGGIVFVKLKNGHWYQFTPKDGKVVFIK